MSANVETIVYYGEVPWHGLGVKLDKPGTSKEAIVAAGLDWEVALRDVYCEINGKLSMLIIASKPGAIIPIAD